MIYRAAITAKVKIVLELLLQLKILSQIVQLGSGTQTCLISQYRLVFTTFTGGWTGGWVAGEMRIKSKS